jgi:phosphatidylinositol-3-phosphatase
MLLAALASSLGCGGSSSSAPPSPPQLTAPAPSAFPQFGHVFLVVEENHNYSDIIGNAAMPYLNSLATQYGLATQYYANIHPSIGNYFMMTTGQLVTINDSFTGTVSVDNIVHELIGAGKTWKAYAESIPSAGYVGGDVYPYAKHHNPFAYFTDVLNSSAQAQNLVPFTQFSADLANNQLPNFSFLLPNLLNDAHDGSLQAADAWLQQNLGPLISSSSFKTDGLLIITFDEADGSVDWTNGGGRVATVIVSAKAKPGYQSATLYQHQSTLRLILHALGVGSYPGAAANAPEMGEFF